VLRHRSHAQLRLFILLAFCMTTTMASWVEYLPGELNLIITVPHNGKEKPEGLEDRKAGYKDNEGLCHFPGTDNPEEMDSDDEVCEVSLGADLYTRSIAKKVSKKLEELTGGQKPHIIVSSMHRSRMDPNRNEEEGAQGRPLAQWAYHEFHGKIAQVKSQMDGPGLLLDFHGQTHAGDRTELGYAVSRTNINKGRKNPENLQRSSIDALALRTGGGHEALIWGDEGLGAFMETLGCRAVPSNRPQEDPKRGDYYGGAKPDKIIYRYGTRNGAGQVDAIQVEMQKDVRKDEAHEEFAEKLGEAIFNFYKRHYNI